MIFDAKLPKNELLIRLATLWFLNKSYKKNENEDYYLSFQEMNKKYQLKKEQYIKIMSRNPKNLEKRINKIIDKSYLENYNSYYNSEFKNIQESLSMYSVQKKELNSMIKVYNLNLSSELSKWLETFIKDKDTLVCLKKIKNYLTTSRSSIETKNIFIQEKDIRNYLNESYYLIEISPKKEIFFKISDILELNQLNLLLSNNIIYLQDSVYDLSYTISITKKELFMRSYYKLAFKIIFLKLLQAHHICKAFSIKDFYFLPLDGLQLYHCENLVYWQNSHHILRCDNCHEQVEYYFENFFSSSSETQESEFICPNCGEHYTYSKLEEIYKKNCEKAYK